MCPVEVAIRSKGKKNNPKDLITVYKTMRGFLNSSNTCLPVGIRVEDVQDCTRVAFDDVVVKSMVINSGRNEGVCIYNNEENGKTRLVVMDNEGQSIKFVSEDTEIVVRRIDPAQLLSL
jgi:hypothetical protein